MKCLIEPADITHALWLYHTTLWSHHPPTQCLTTLGSMTLWGLHHIWMLWSNWNNWKWMVPHVASSLGSIHISWSIVSNVIMLTGASWWFFCSHIIWTKEHWTDLLDRHMALPPIDCGCNLSQCLLPQTVLSIMLSIRYLQYMHDTINQEMSNVPKISKMEYSICVAPTIMPYLNFDNLTCQGQPSQHLHWLTEYSWYRFVHFHEITE